MPLAHGKNVVNVILTDFRALDTLGEITVLGTAALGVFALLGSADLPVGGTAPESTVIVRVTSTLIQPVMFVFSVFLLVRGHDQPGGGFAGGLVFAAAFALRVLSHGLASARARLRVDPRVLVALGLTFALTSALLGVSAGEPFFAALWTRLGRGQDAIEFGTPLLFDLGVYLVVGGAILTVLFALQRERSEAT